MDESDALQTNPGGYIHISQHASRTIPRKEDEADVDANIEPRMFLSMRPKIVYQPLIHLITKDSHIIINRSDL